MDKKLLKVLLNDTAKCHFKKVQNTLKSQGTKMATQDALTLVISCCTASVANKSTPEVGLEEDLCYLVKFLLDFIVEPTDKQVEQYLQSVFHIIKLISAKGNTKVILQFEEMLLPHFHPTVFEGNAGTIYRSHCSLINKIITSSTSDKNPNGNQHVIGLCYLLIRMHSERVPNQEGLITAIYNASLNLIRYSKVKSTELYEFYCCSLKSVGCILNKHEDVSRFFISFTEIYLKLFSSKQFGLVSSVCDRLLDKLPNLFKRDDIQNFREILSITKWLNPQCTSDNRGIISKCYNSLKKVVKRLEKADGLLKSTCDLIISLLSGLVQYYKDNKKEAIEKEENDLMDFFDILSLVAEIYSKFPSTCSCGCRIKTDLYQAVKSANHIPSLGSLYILKNEGTSDFVESILYGFRLQSEWLEAFKEENCKKLETVWTSTGTKLYNFALKLHELRKDGCYLDFLKLFLQFLYKLEGLASTTMDKKYFGIVFGLMADYYYDQKLFEKALIHSALCMSLATTDRKTAFVFWANSKVALRKANHIEELTIPAVIETYKSEIESYLPGFELDVDKQIELLIFELNQCKSQWWSKIAMMTAFRHLCRLADPLVQAEVFVQIWGKFDSNVHETLPDLLNCTLEEYEKHSVKNSNRKLILAHLYYLRHKYRVNGDMVNVCQEIDKNTTIGKSNESPNEPNTDPNNECDVVSSYDCLRLNKYVKMMKNLNKSLALADEVVNKRIFLKCPDNLKRFHQLLKDIAFEYRLHSHQVSHFQAWELVLKIAQYNDNKLWMLESIGFILDFADASKDFVKNLIDTGDSIIELDLPDSFETKVAYNLSKATAYLRCDVDKAYGTFRKLYEIRNEFQSNFILSVRFLLLHHKVISLPCGFKVEGHHEYSLIKIHEAYGKFFCVRESFSAYEMALTFEVQEEVARLYHNLRMPREVRCYAKTILVTSQKMMLPFRTMSFLYYLAMADLRTRHMDDGRVKISGMSDILNLSKSRSNLKSPGIPLEPAEKFERVMSGLNCEFKELMLDAPMRSFRQQSPGSPVFQTENFKFPNSFCHQSDCTCFQCTSPEYFYFVLKRTYLLAMLNVWDSNTANARGFFAGGVKMYNFYKEKQTEFSIKLGNNVSQDLVPDFRDFCFETYCKLLLEYVNTLLRSRSFFEADEVNKNLVSYLKPQKLNYIYLYNESLLQRLNVIEFLKSQGVRRKDTVKVENLLSVPDDSRNARTPETKMSQVSMVSMIPDSVKRPKRTLRKIKFDLSDEDESDLKAEKTPLPQSKSKIKVFSEASSSRKNKRTVLAEMPQPPKCDLSNDSIISMSPGAHTPGSLRALDRMQMLSSKTRLLTEKLKTPKPIKVEISRENSESSVKNIPVRKSKRNINK